MGLAPSRHREDRRALAVEPLPEGIEHGLAEPAAHPDDPSASAGVETLQTHISFVFLTAERVYKLRKPVDLGFLDFASREARNRDCLREVALNRRLAPDVYLGVAPVLAEAGRFRLGPPGEALAAPGAGAPAPEHCVVMRRLAAGADALSRLQRGELDAGHLDAVAERVARFHAEHGLGAPAPFEPAAWLERISGPVADNFAAFDGPAGACADPAVLERARRAARLFEDKEAWRFERRREQGRAVDGHGDLHLQHVWFEGDSREPLLIDCIEFSERLRRIDAASDVAFLAMDLVYRDQALLAERFLRRYARASDDFDLYHVVDYYVAYRAGVRAKVAALAAEEAEIPAAQRRAAAESARRHLALAARALERERRGGLVLVCGIVGTGKSSVAELAADALPGVVISSDRVRKRLAGLAPAERAGGAWGRGLYTAERTQQVYAALLERAEPVVASGRAAILDATFARTGFRDQARRWAEARGAPVVLVEVRCERGLVLERLARRAREGRDPSDAGPELYERSAAAFEPTDAWPAARRCALRSDAPGWREAAAAELRALWSRARGPQP